MLFSCEDNSQTFAAGDIDLSVRLRVGASERVMGPTGLSGFLDDAEVSIRDLAYQMMTVSDNTATDVIMKQLGLERINQTIKELGLRQTVLVGDCRVLLDSLLEDLGLEPGTIANVSGLDRVKVRAARSLTPEETTRSTPREMTQLLGMIWRDEAGSQEACATVRRWMGLQVWRDRLLSGFPDDVTVSGKTGTLPGIRNEAGVVEFPDGGRSQWRCSPWPTTLPGGDQRSTTRSERRRDWRSRLYDQELRRSSCARLRSQAPPLST